MITTKMRLRRIEKRIKTVKARILGLGEMRTGSLSKQYNVCGNPTCSCKDRKNPKKHGPYYQLSFVHLGKSSSQFIKKEFLLETRRQIETYKRCRDMFDKWVGLETERAMLKLQLGRVEKKHKAEREKI